MDKSITRVYILPQTHQYTMMINILV